MGNRVKDYLGNTYRIFEDNSILPYMRYAPTEEAIKNTKKFFKDYAANPNGKNALQTFKQKLWSILLLNQRKNKKDLQVYLLNILMKQLQMKDQN